MGRTPISHVVYGAQDVEVTAARLRRGLGLEAIPGSRFDDIGLADWFVPFEDQYIELLTVADDEVAMRTPFGRWGGRADRHGATGCSRGRWRPKATSTRSDGGSARIPTRCPPSTARA